MSGSPRVRRRALIFVLGTAATGTVAESAAAQQSGNRTGTEPATDGGNTTDDRGTETDGEQDTESVGPRLDLDCYVLTVDGERYASVELRFADGTAATFDDGYSGTTTFGYGGDGRLDAEAETAVTEFHGPIAWATVVVGEATETATNSGRCPFADLFFDCDTAQFSRGNDVRMRFVDGSVKRWDPPADPGQTRFGSPGRVVESVAEESADIEVANPNIDCEPGEPATVFDCTEVTVGPAEFATEPTFDRVTLTFVDGATQSLGARDDSGFTAPETFAGTDDHDGKVIESIGIEKRDGDIAFRLVNPTVDDCEIVPEDAGEAAEDDAEAETDSTAGEAGGGPRGGDEPRRGPPETDSESTDAGESGDAQGSPDPGDTDTGGGAAVDEEAGSPFPWWGWLAGAGGAAGTVSYLVSRALGPESEAVDEGNRAAERRASVDEPPSRWDEFGNK